MRRAWMGFALLAAGLSFPKAASAQVVYLPYPSYGPLWSGPLVNTLPAWRSFGGGFNGGYGGGLFPRGSYAIAGVNSPGIGLGGERPSNTRTRKIEIRPTRAEEIIKERSLVGATALKIGTAGVTVRTRDGETVRYNAGDVYFFIGEDLVTVRSTPGVIEPGSRVMVPAE